MQSNSVRLSNGRKSYSAPGFKRLSPEEAKKLLLERADAKDPEVLRLLARIEEVRGEKGS